MMDFDRAMNVRVNGKEVNRFAINGITIWEKYTPSSVLLESDKSYASEGDTINLTATVNDKFNRGCPNTNVDFYICDQLIQSVEEAYEATRDAKYFLSEGDFTNKSIEFTVDAISGSIDILCEAATIRPFFRMTGLQVGDIVKITDDGTFVKGYVNDNLTYTANHINNPGMIGFSLPNGATLTFSHFTEKGEVLIDSDMTDDTGVATVSYLVKDTNTLNIKAKSSNAESNLLIILTNVLWNPPLDGTESIHSLGRGGSLTVANGVLRGKAGYVYGFDNVDHWKLSFEAYFTGGGFVVTDSTVTRYDTNYLQFLSGYLRVFTNGTYTDYVYTGNTLIGNEWNIIEVEKINNQYIVSINGDIVLTNVTWSRNPSQFGVGVDSWGTNINQVNNIFVQKLN